MSRSILSWRFSSRSQAGEVPAVSAVDPLTVPGPSEPKLFAGG